MLSDDVDMVSRTARRRCRCRYCGKFIVRARTFYGVIQPGQSMRATWLTLGEKVALWDPVKHGVDDCRSGDCYERRGGVTRNVKSRSVTE